VLPHHSPFGYQFGEAGSPGVAIQALRHVPRRCPGAPEAPSAPRSPWTASQATWHHAVLAISVITRSPESVKGPLSADVDPDDRDIGDPRHGATVLSICVAILIIVAVAGLAVEVVTVVVVAAAPDAGPLGVILAVVYGSIPFVIGTIALGAVAVVTAVQHASAEQIAAIDRGTAATAIVGQYAGQAALRATQQR
jgi:hypothetical protein